jgi:hypothetical protein
MGLVEDGCDEHEHGKGKAKKGGAVFSEEYREFLLQ